MSFEVFFDGECPLCAREIRMLRRMDRSGAIRFTDIADPAFDPASVAPDVDRSALMARIHGRRADGTLVTGVDVFRELYAAVGFPRLVAMTRWPGIAHVLELGYRVFAKNRLWLTGRSADQCTADGRCAT